MARTARTVGSTLIAGALLAAVTGCSFGPQPMPTAPPELQELQITTLSDAAPLIEGGYIEAVGSWYDANGARYTERSIVVTPERAAWVVVSTCVSAIGEHLLFMPADQRERAIEDDADACPAP